MANPITQYLKETRSELNHVAWPTQKQTIIFTLLVAAISLGVAAYLGAFDYLFTTALTDMVRATGGNSSAVVQQPAASTSTTPAQAAPNFALPGTTPAK